jgi:O-antigen/teichoic acid export membrane protein
MLALPFLLYGAPLLSLVFGEDFAPANIALMILCLAQLASAMFGPNALLLVMAGSERRVTRAIAAALIINAAVLLLLVPSLGQVGAAWAAGVGLLTWNSIAWWDAYRIVGVNTFFLSAGMKRIEPTS